MEQEKFQQIVREYSQKVEFAKQHALHHERMAKRWEWALIGCSAITTILAAFSSVIRALPITPITLLFSTVVTIIAGIMHRRNQQKWFSYQKYRSDLENEYRWYLSGAGRYKGVRDKEAFFTIKYSDIVHEFDQTIHSQSAADTNLLIAEEK